MRAAVSLDTSTLGSTILFAQSTRRTLMTRTGSLPPKIVRSMCAALLSLGIVVAAEPAQAGPLILRLDPAQSQVTITLSSSKAVAPAKVTTTASGLPPTDGLQGKITLGSGNNEPGLLDIYGGGGLVSDTNVALSFGSGGTLNADLQGLHVSFGAVSGMTPIAPTPGDPGAATYSLSFLTLYADGGELSYVGSGSFGGFYGSQAFDFGSVPLQLAPPYGGVGTLSLSGGDAKFTVPINVTTPIALFPAIVNATFTGQLVFVTVPEPSTWLLAGLGGAGLVLARYRARLRAR
jgi:hypothetical protein